MSEGTSGGDADRGASTPDWAIQQMLTAVARKLEVVGVDDHAFSFVSIDAIQGVVRVHRVGALAPSIETMYRRAAPAGVPVLFVDSVLTAGQRANLSEWVSEQQGWLLSRGVRLEAWGGDERGGYQITHSGPGEVTDEIRQRLELYGPGTVNFERGRTISL
jgi:hypothetical protein